MYKMVWLKGWLFKYNRVLKDKQLQKKTDRPAYKREGAYLNFYLTAFNPYPCESDSLGTDKTESNV